VKHGDSEISECRNLLDGMEIKESDEVEEIKGEEAVSSFLS